jgi:uncharacterized protein YcbX
VPSVSWLSVAPVKGLALVRVDEVKLESFGVLENRRFHVLTRDGRFVNGLTRLKRSLFEVVPAWDAESDSLRLTFPDGRVIEDVVRLGDPVATWFYRRAEYGRVVEGPWSDALSEFAGQPLWLARTDRPGAAVDRSNGAVSLVSDASVDELARRAGVDRVDARRFRMLIGLAGCDPHEEDEWIGRDVLIGDAVVRVREQVARCAITTQDPDSGRRDLDTLRVIKEYRGVRGSKSLDFGVYGEVLEPGRIRVGDAAEPIASELYSSAR